MSQYFGKRERAIILVIYEAQRPMSIKEIAEKTDMSWITIRGWLKVLYSKGFVVKRKSGNSSKKWALNYDLIDDILR
jgi:DNA-binding transcriptional ArsR family regulator